MKQSYLIKIGEIALKGNNRNFFEKKLKKNIKTGLRGIPSRVYGGRGRFFVETDAGHSDVVEKVLSTTFGIKGFSAVTSVNKDIDLIIAEAVRQARAMMENGAGPRFKINPRRADKRFPLRSYDIACRAGDEILRQVPGTAVDVRDPDWAINIEIRDNAFVYGHVSPAPGGLPVGSAGGGMLMLSGGIDSPVAGWLMAKRGLKLSAAYFHTWPYTSDEARKKVEDLAAILAGYNCGINLYVVNFTDIQLRIKEKGPERATTVLMRNAMVRVSDILAKKEGGLALVTGEALSQVASQTPESIRYTGSGTDLPIFRPLIGMDKEDIIRIAEDIGTFRTSILPYDDCCTLFAPEHPVTRPDFELMRLEFDKLELDLMIEEAAEKAEKNFYDGAYQ